jgi:hypothetical protein
MPILNVTPYGSFRAGVVESMVVPISLARGGTTEYMRGTFSFRGGVLDKVAPHIVTGGGVVEQIGLPVSARAGVVEQLNVFVRCMGGVIEILAPAAALTDTFYSFVMNTKTTGAAEYTNFPFTSLFKVGAVFYGITATGLHQLTGNNDNGAEIEGLIVSGPSNFGTSDYKLLPSAYAHMGLGELQVSTRLDDEEEWSDPYEASQDTEGIRSEYISMARGEKGVYIQLKIESGDMTLEKFEQNFVPTGRKRL